ncbi:hypothetical protein [Luteibacter sp. 22Crub2.1]|uniref:hypothetical protein n=1 Tax=Luteibacter sp. 22Crub2.1 TaxID=1283288 RepID=UPI0009A8D37F|nr:hypothetical protein [Luteibacter sp. 22Crub2.1]SKB50263.1 hypothetical protein SAMN05660880_01344 [Luteibacter sp. 22Crub2.1]
MAFKKYAPLLTPPGTAVFPSLTVPDTKFKPEGEYAVKLSFDPTDERVSALVADLEKRRDELFEAFKAEELDKAGDKRKLKAKELEKWDVAPVFTEELDKDGEETGRILINLKMKASGVTKTGKKWSQKPTIFDAKGKKMDNPPDIYGGSTLRVSFETIGGPVQSAKTFYLSNRLLAVKLLQLVARGGYSADSLGMGEEEDGYEADEAELKGSSAAPRTSANDEGDDAPADAGDGDF